MKAQAQGHLETLEELDQGHPLRVKPRGARGEHLPHDSDGAENAEKRDYSTAERRRLAREGKALPNLSYPIETVEDLHNAAVLARSGHGDVEAARRLIARRAKELGVQNPLDSSKSRFQRMLEAHTAKDLGNPVSSPFQVLRDRGLAVGHPDLIQHDASQVDGHARLATAAAPDTSRELTWAPGTANVSYRDYASQSGAAGPLQPNDHPLRPGYHQAPIGENNGTHDSDSRFGACTTPRQSMKSMSPFEIMKAHLRGEL